jgi:hypothetical protein
VVCKAKFVTFCVRQGLVYGFNSIQQGPLRLASNPAPGRLLQWVKVRLGWILREVGFGEVDWIGLAKDRNRWRAVVNSVLNLRVP